MRLLRPGLQRATDVPLVSGKIPLTEDLAWLGRKLGREEVLFEDIAEVLLWQDKDLSDEQRRQLLGLQRNLRGDSRNATEQPIGAAAEGEVNLLTLRNVVLPKGEPEKVQNVRQQMPHGLWGHEMLVDAFVRFSKECLSPGRPCPPLMILGGDVAHGKDQALQAFATSYLGETAQIVTVDLHGLTDRDIGAIFGEGPPPGPLYEGEMVKYAEGGQTLLHLLNPHGLIQRAPKLTEMLVQRLIAERGSGDYYDVPYVFDLDQDAEVDPRLTLLQSLGTSVNRAVSSTAQFEHLDGPTMARYAQAVLPEMLTQEGLENLSFDFDQEALELLGEMLATPHAPLDELKARLNRFVLCHIATQVSIDRDHPSVIRVSLDQTVKHNPKFRQQLVHEMSLETADLALAESAFFLSQVAIAAPTIDGNIREIPQQVQENYDILLVDLVSAISLEAHALLENDALQPLITELRPQLALITRISEQSVRFQYRELLTPAQCQQVVQALRHADQCIVAGLDAGLFDALSLETCAVLASARSFLRDAAAAYALAANVDVPNDLRSDTLFQPHEAKDKESKTRAKFLDFLQLTQKAFEEAGSASVLCLAVADETPANIALLEAVVAARDYTTAFVENASRRHILGFKDLLSINRTHELLDTYAILRGAIASATTQDPLESLEADTLANLADTWAVSAKAVQQIALFLNVEAPAELIVEFEELTQGDH